MLHYLESLANSDGDIRVTFRLSTASFVVVKIINPNNSKDVSVNSVKVWTGDYDKVKSYWSTTTPLTAESEARSKDEAILLIKQARDLLSRV